MNIYCLESKDFSINYFRLDENSTNIKKTRLIKYVYVLNFSIK